MPTPTPAGAVAPPPKPDVALIEAAARLLVFPEPGQVVELRAWDVQGAGYAASGTQSGYYDDPVALARAAAALSPVTDGVYLTLNKIDPALLARRCNRLERVGEQDSTADHHVQRRQWLPIDLDPVRPAKTSSTDAQHELALQRAQAVRAFLAGMGFPDPVSGDSGNGAHLLYPIDLPRDDGGLLQRCLQALAVRFDDDAVQIDQKVSNPARVWKLYGTVARKGEHLPGHGYPHRLAVLLDVPAALEPVPLERLQALAAGAPPPPVPAPGPGGRAAPGQPFDLEAFVARGEAELGWTGRWGDWGQGGRKYVFNTCPLNADHSDRAAYALAFANGAVAFGCHHNGCAGKGWADLKALLPPPARAERGAEDGSADGGTDDATDAARPPYANGSGGRRDRAGRLAEAVGVVRALPVAARLSAADEASAKEARAVWLDPYVGVSTALAARAPRRYHEAAGVTLLCMAIARRAGYRVNPVKTVYASLMLALCSRSSVFGKTDAQKVAQEVLRLAGLADVLLLPRKFSPEAVLATLALQVPASVREGGKKHRQHWLERHIHGAQRGVIRDELHSLFAEAAEERGSGLLDLVLLADDAPASLDGGLTLARGAHTATDVCLSILGATTPAMLRDVARSPRLWHSGVFGRVLVLGPGAAPAYGGRPGVAPGLLEAVVAGLKKIYTRLGVPRLELVTDTVTRRTRDGDEVEEERIIGARQWDYAPLEASFDDDAWALSEAYGRGLFELLLRPGFPDRLSPTYGRLPELAQRTALALATAEHCLTSPLTAAGTVASREVRIARRHWCAAQLLAEDWRAGVHEALAEIVRDPETAEQDEAEDAAEAIATARARKLVAAALVTFRRARETGEPDPGLKMRDCNAVFSRNLDYDELVAALDQLVAQGVFLRETGEPGPKGGRPPILHRLDPAYAAAHPELFPETERTNAQTPPDLGETPTPGVCARAQTPERGLPPR